MKIILILAFSLLLLSVSMPKKYERYCNEHAFKAQLLQGTTGVPASIQLAQAIFESGGGRSNIAKQANNHFGIRCGDNWEGGRYYSESGCWRAYDSVGLSYVDHACFLNEHYQNAVGKSWGYWSGLEGYGSGDYWRKIGSIVKRYKLYEYDL